MTDDPIFVDANVLLETILQSREHAELARQYLSTNRIIISPLTAHLLVYFGQKDGLKLDQLLNLLTKHKFSDFGTEQITWAIQNHQDNDFEDAIQVACAVTSEAQTFATFDKNLASKYQEFIKMQVLSLKL